MVADRARCPTRIASTPPGSSRTSSQRPKDARTGSSRLLGPVSLPAAANDVAPGTGTFGGEANTIHLVSADLTEDWPRLSKEEVGMRLVSRIADWFDTRPEAAR